MSGRARRLCGTARLRPAAVARVTKLDRSRLKIGKGSRPATRRTAAVVPAFSRMELAAPAVAIRPFAEVETTAGVKLRLFTATDQVLGLLSSLCGVGGGR